MRFTQSISEQNIARGVEMNEELHISQKMINKMAVLSPYLTINILNINELYSTEAESGRKDKK